MSSREISRQASIVDSDESTPIVDAKSAPPVRSVWSPDTPDTTNSFNYRPSGSSLASVMANSLGGDAAPPVPALPANYSKSPQHEFDSPGSFTSNRNEDDGSPCTLFEEDGGSARLRPARLGLSPATPDSATSRSHGWWDHVVTPFLDKKLSLLSPVGWRAKAESPQEGSSSPRSGFGLAENNAGPAWSSSGSLLPLHAPIVRKPCPRKGQSPPASLPSEYSSTTSLPRQGQEAVGREAVGRSPDLESEKPPPYSPPKKKAVAPLQFRAVFPTQHPLHAQFPPSPYQASPGLGATMTSQGASQTPIGRGPASPVSGARLPARPQRAFVCHDYFGDDTAIRAHKVERQRRRHEKEDKVARRMGGLWRGRGCVPSTGCFGRRGREGRKRRRAWLMVWAGLTCVMILVLVLVVVLTGRHRDAPAPPESIWVNLTSFPPMPTGVLTVVGLDNSVSRSACTEPSTLWSCSLPKEEHKSAEPYKANQPTVAMQIQWEKDTASSHDMRSEPKAPDAKEVWFLGNTTDNVRSEHKAGETTPFFISLATTVAGLNDGPKLTTNQGAGPRSGNSSLQTLLPPPDLEADGTAAAAVMIPKALRQPVRLFDRGLDSEHYGFYTHFKRTMFLKSVTILKGTEGGNVPLDEDGGCRKDEADYVVTWAETRVLVQIWTRSLDTNASSLLRASGDGQRPGSMPYPVTLTLDTHGGDPNKKVVWSWPVDKRQKVLANKAELLANRMGAGGSWINPRGSGDARMGGFDGGTGGFQQCSLSSINHTSFIDSSTPHRTPFMLNARPRLQRQALASGRRRLLTLAIETSCDDTAVALLRRQTGLPTQLLFNERIASDNRPWGGVNPPVAIAGHHRCLAPLVSKALAALPPDQSKPDVVAATRGPGLPAYLNAGLGVAKGLSLAWGVPFLAVHHLQAHALTPRLVHALKGGDEGVVMTEMEMELQAVRPVFPFLTLLVSGGHTQLLVSTGLTSHSVIAETLDSAIGNALDKAARYILTDSELDLCPDVQYGRHLEAFAFPPELGDVSQQHASFFQPALSRHEEQLTCHSGYEWALPMPLKDTRTLAFSFTGIASHVETIMQRRPDMALPERRQLARHTLQAMFQHIASRLCIAIMDAEPVRRLADSFCDKSLRLILAGGVAANRFLPHVLRTTLAARGLPSLEMVVPPLELCTDNAAMIAWTADEMFRAGWESDLSVCAEPKWSMESRWMVLV
ncbi:hypothetical protein CDD80_4083 [Ophiocordyceps camponoti-rufipedis]|uniref:N(6)-L-threonylcarbamoyladenine synthase n=1 Tax=Ophiocordyceps camponoti-rufipedis TaxID=2004952 RepID=A0A2C5Y4P3_9HYPO|nr:hypothetical protein CDD80_4083 [Ophiocordyceps camponoti-rufipedis]